MKHKKREEHRLTFTPSIKQFHMISEDNAKTGDNSLSNNIFRKRIRYTKRDISRLQEYLYDFLVHEGVANAKNVIPGTELYKLKRMLKEKEENKTLLLRGTPGPGGASKA